MLVSRPLRRALAIVGAVGLTIFGGTSCGGAADPTGAPVASVQLSDTALTLRVGDDAALTARVLDVGGQELVGRRIFWSSRDPSIVEVTQAGVVRAVATGSTQIAANIEGHSMPARVTVLARPVASLQLDPPTAQIVVTTRRRLTARALNDQGAPVTAAITWTSLNPTIVTVNGAGEVHGVSPGIGTVQATADGQTATATIVVIPVPVASVRVTPGTDTLTVGTTRQFTATPLDSTGTPVAGRDAAWTSRDPGVAAVSSSGQVTAVSPGTATVVATAEGRAATATVVVRAVPVATVVLTPNASTIGVGGSVRLSAVPTDGAGNALAGRTVQFTSSTPSVATVSADGTVTGVAAGTATIRAESEGATGSATVQVTATTSVASVDVTPSTATLTIGGTRALAATPRTSSGAPITGRTVTWSSGAPSIVTVSATGVVTAVGAGTGQVLAQVDGVTGTATITVQRVPVASVAVSPATASVPARSAVQLAATPRDASGAALNDRVVAWSSSNESVASVSSTGRVVATAPGTATVRATSEGVVGTATITVADAMRVSPDTLRLRDRGSNNRTGQLIVTDYAGRVVGASEVTWRTSNAAIAAVDATGLVLGVNTGTTTITATARGATAVATVIVTRN